MKKSVAHRPHPAQTVAKTQQHGQVQRKLWYGLLACAIFGTSSVQGSDEDPSWDQELKKTPWQLRRNNTKNKNQRDIDGQELLQAIKNKDLNKAVGLLDKKPNLEITDDTGATALHWVAGYGLDFIDHLLQKGANKDALDNNNDTPLHVAVKQGQLLTVGSLVTSKANKTLKNKQGKTPLDLANELSDDKQGKASIIKSLQTDHTNTIPSNPNNTLFSQKNILIGITILIIVAGLGYLFCWPTPQDATPRHTKSKQEQSTQATRPAK